MPAISQLVAGRAGRSNWPWFLSGRNGVFPPRECYDVLWFSISLKKMCWLALCGSDEACVSPDIFGFLSVKELNTSDVVFESGLGLKTTSTTTTVTILNFYIFQTLHIILRIKTIALIYALLWLHYVVCGASQRNKRVCNCAKSCMYASK